MARLVCAVALQALLLATVCSLASSADFIADEERFPGWKGELPSATLSVGEGTVGFGELGKVLGWEGEGSMAGEGAHRSPRRQPARALPRPAPPRRAARGCCPPPSPSLPLLT